MPNPSTEADQTRLKRLMDFLAVDPTNRALLRDTGEAALSAGEPEMALGLFDRLGALGDLSAEEQNIRGHAALAVGDTGIAIPIFEKLLQSAPGDPALNFNLAWAHALAGDYRAVLTLLDAKTTAALPQAAALEVRALHSLGQFEEAGDRARVAMSRFGNDRGLAATVSVLALDLDDLDLARRAAETGGDLPDALTTRATIALNDENPKDAEALFKEALARDPHAPRALIGLGLTHMLAGDTAGGASSIEQGATIFKDHIGSWIAAGWARLLIGDLTAARQHFATALSIDRGFGETHGSLAVLALLEGNVSAARHDAQAALKLDSQSFSGALAMSMLAASDGNGARARAILDRALETPIDARGRTLAKILTAYGTRS